MSVRVSYLTTIFSLHRLLRLTSTTVFDGTNLKREVVLKSVEDFRDEDSISIRNGRIGLDFAALFRGGEHDSLDRRRPRHFGLGCLHTSVSRRTC